MKSPAAALLPLLFTSLLIGGCSGLDDPITDEETRPSDYDGAYKLTVIPPADDAGACSDALGTMRLNDGNVTGEATDVSTGEAITLSGSVEADGFIKGSLVFSFGGNAGSYSGLMSTSGSGDGTWKDTSDCTGTWTAAAN
jgi:hypothetical protein